MVLHGPTGFHKYRFHLPEEVRTYSGRASRELVPAEDASLCRPKLDLANDGAPLKVALSTEPNQRPSVPREPFSREFHSYHFRGSSHS